MSKVPHDATLDFPNDRPIEEPGGGAPEPGAILLFDGQKATCHAIALGETPIVLGRGSPLLGPREDPAMSRQHARLSYRAGKFLLADLASRNGSALDRQPLRGEVTTTQAHILRLGHSLLLLAADVRPFRSPGVRVDGARVEGPTLQRLLRQVPGLAEMSRTLFISGESGAGKETIAQTFHRAGPQGKGPFVTVNCATIPEGLAERLLFGAQKGAYTGSSVDSQGYVLAADTGTLFLDEIGDLDTTVQAKLVRALESGEVMVLGTTRPRKADVRICSATHKDLRALVADGKFRADLFFRLGSPQLALPPLRERPEEISFMVCQAVRQVDPKLAVHVSLVEACLLRTWPGNVRELLSSVRTAAIAAIAADHGAVGAQHLSAQAGIDLVASAHAPHSAASFPPPAGELLITPVPVAPPAVPNPPKLVRSLARTQILAAILATNGNISSAARALGLHRTQLRRLMARYQIDPAKLRE